MCGICGVIGIERTEQAEAITRRMMEALRHSGPDEDGHPIALSLHRYTRLYIGAFFIGRYLDRRSTDSPSLK
jgi:asparagine synthetase B (glutamine-hydrolysing)